MKTFCSQFPVLSFLCALLVDLVVVYARYGAFKGDNSLGMITSATDQINSEFLLCKFPECLSTNKNVQKVHAYSLS